MNEEQQRGSRDAGSVQLFEVPLPLKHVVEALIFASDEPLDIKTIRLLIDDFNRNAEPGDRLEAGSDLVRAAIEELNQEFEEAQKPYRIIALAGGFAFATEKEYAGWIGKLLKEKARRRLSQTAVETLAIVAYKQPITKSEVEFIRGVNSDYIMKALLEKNLITITGRASTPGRPLLYGTTTEFLKHFGLNEISDLPKPREIEELIGETEFEVEKHLLAEQQEIEFKEELEGKLEGHEGTKQKPRAVRQAKKPRQTKVEKDLRPTIQGNAEVGNEESAVRSQQSEVGEQQSEIGSRKSEVSNEKIEAQGGKTEIEDVRPETRETAIVATVEAGIHHAGNVEEQPQSVNHQPSIGDRQSSILSTWKTKIQTFFRKLFG
ncbi:MAG: SMC-Scp complex subunit ScpB [Bacteroidota bacterium]|nr:SMC-Scp complex subunit ScpB [Bacteroidota bacterium]